MQASPKIYISYSWSEQEMLIADTIDQDWQSVGIKLIRDKRDVNYKDSLKDFMRSMPNGDYVLAIIGQGYLQSKNCMFEALELFRHPEFKDKILPVIAPNAGIHSGLGKAKYVKYWEDKISELNQEIKALGNLSNIQSISEELDHFTRIRNSFSDFAGILSDMRAVSWPDIREKQYKEIFEHIGFSTEDTGIKAECLRILDINDKEERELQLYELHAKYPRNYTVLYGLVSTFHQAGEFKKAKSHLLEIMKIFQEEWISYFLLGDIEMNLANYEEALKSFNKALTIRPDSYETHYSLAQYYNQVEDAAKMRMHLEQALKTAPDSTNRAGLFSQLSILLNNQFNDLNGACAMLEQAIEIEPDNDKLYYNLGFLLLQSGDNAKYDQARENFEHALAINPKQVQAQRDLGYLFYMHFKNYDKALEHYTSALIVEPNNPITHMNISNIYRLDLRSYKEALFHVQQAERLAPNDYNIQISFAHLLMKQLKNYPLARTKFEQAIKLEPGSAQAHFDLAFLLCSSGPIKEEVEAREHYVIACGLSQEYKTTKNDGLFGIG
jgi:tetratricopeptide (TPR) repeat protein